MALHYAARTGDLKRLRKELAAGVDVDTPYGEGQTALHDAASHGHTACLKALLAAGASVHDVQPLDAALVNEHMACVHALIAAGANVTRANLRPLFTHSSCRSRTRILKILLRAGANVNTVRVERRTNAAWARVPRIDRYDMNRTAWALVDQIRADGGWANYVARHPPTTFASIVFKATHGELPDPIPLIIATFLVPPGGF